MVRVKGTYGRSQIHRSVSETRQLTMDEVPLALAECDDATFQRDCVAIILDAALGRQWTMRDTSARQLSAALCSMRDRFRGGGMCHGRKPVGIAALPLRKRVCVHCGQEFTSRSPAAKYCSKACSNIVSWERYKARRRG